MKKELEALLKSFHSFSIGEKFQALQSLRKARSHSAIPVLRTLYDRERNLDVKREILKAYADIGDYAAVEGLLDALHGHQPDLQLEAVRRLARIKSARAKGEFSRILEGEEWDLIRLILPIFQPPYAGSEDLPLLVSVSQRAPNPTIKYLAEKAMKEIQG